MAVTLPPLPDEAAVVEITHLVFVDETLIYGVSLFQGPCPVCRGMTPLWLAACASCGRDRRN